MVRDSYKQTEVGVIPEDWEIKTIGDIGSVSSGGTPSRTNSLYWNGSIPWITTTQIDFNVINDAEQFITEAGLNNSAAKLFPPGTLLMAMYGQGKTRGKVGILGIKASTNQACAAILLNREIENSYIFHYLLSQYENIRSLSNTGNQENLNGLIIKSIKIPVPSTEEQKAIAQALSDIDALIASLDKLIVKKRAIKAATMQQLLTGEKRLPGFGGGKDYKKMEIGIIPEDWILIPLEKISAFITKGATPTTYGFSWVQDGVLFLRSECVSDNGLDISQSMFISHKAHTVLNRSELRAGDILITITGNVGRVIYLGNEFGIANMNQHIARIRIIDNSVHPEFVYYFLSQNSVRKTFNSITTGQAYPQISLKQVRDAIIPLPTLEEQQSIATVLSDMDAEIAALESRLAKTQAIKQGMMQELLTGRTRLV